MLEGICRLCLKTCKRFQYIGASTRNIIDMLQLKINLAVSREPVICTNCATMLINSLDFKLICVYTHQYIVSLFDNTYAKMDLKEVFQNEKGNILGIKIPENHDICGFCIALAKRCYTTPIDYQNVMLEKCLPGLDLSIINAPVICGHCKESLDSSSHFMENCAIVEEIIQKYCKAKGINSEGVIKLISVQQYMSTNMLSGKEDNTRLDIMRKEETFLKEVGRNNESLINKKPDYVKKFVEVEHQSDNVVKQMEQKLRDQNLNSIQQFPSDSEDKQCFKIEHIEIKAEQNHFDRFHDEDTSPQLNAGVESLPNQHNEVIPTMYQCDSCSFKTWDRGALHNHKSACLFQTRHPLINKNQLAMYWCDSCPFKTKHREALHHHKLTHKKPPIRRYRCVHCPFRTTCKSIIEIHVLTHKRQTTYLCKSCAFQTKYERNMQLHMKTHEVPTVYQCDSCAFNTTYESALGSHCVLVHKNPSEVNEVVV